MLRQENKPSWFYQFIGALSAELILQGMASYLSIGFDKWFGKASKLEIIAAGIVIFFLIYGGIYFFFSRLIGKRFYSWWVNFKFRLLKSTKTTKHTVVFPPTDRGSSEDFKKRVIKNIERSKRLYFLLLSAHTMFYDERETFIMDKIKNLPAQELKEKDIKFLLMDKNNTFFRKRGEWFVGEMRRLDYPYHVFTYNEYLNRCKEIEREILKIPINLKFYKTIPVWRLMLFDEELFVSIYQPEVEGHLSAIYMIKKISDHPKMSLYWGFYDYFTSLYSEWTEDDFQ